MAHLIEVSFKGHRREFFVWEGEEPPKLHAPVIVEADRGEDLGRVHSVGELAERRCTGCAHGCGTERPTRKVIRAATADDERRAAELRVQDDEARRKAMEKVRAHSLVMKVSDAEWQWDRRKLTFYFTAEKRVDFRSLVRDLAAVFRTRIELKQIGVRDEAKRLSGVGRCGREYCSASWLPDLRPVNLQIAKDQRLSLNPSQISGACGRLMCCLRYEHDFYVQARKRFPKEGRILVTTHGEEKVIANDIFRERVTLRSSEGDIRVVAVAELGRELRQPVPFTVEAEEDAAVALAVDSRDDEVPDETDSTPAARTSTVLPASAREAPAVGAPRTSGRRRGRRGGRRGRSGNDAPGSPSKE
jgi:cell fate regulator YaaT (PSP1 superfamily)